MKKKGIAVVLISTVTIASMSLTGCGGAKIEQLKDSMTIELGEEFAFDVNEYFEQKSGEDFETEDYQLDATSVDTQKCGEYEMTITFYPDEKKSQDFTVDVVVEDTVAPTAKLNEDILPLQCLWLNDLEADLSEYVLAEDLSEYHIEAEFEMIAEPETATSKVISKYVEALAETESEAEESTEASTEEETQETETEVEGTETEGTEVENKEYSEGFYSCTLTAVDEAGNRSEGVKVLAIYDKTPVTVTVTDADGKKKKLDASKDKVSISVSDTDLEKFVSTVKISDNFDETVKATESNFKATDNDNEYIFTYADKAGNKYSQTFVLKKKETESASNSSSGGSSSGGSSSGGSSDSGSSSSGGSSSGGSSSNDSSSDSDDSDSGEGNYSALQKFASTHHNGIYSWNGEYVAISSENHKYNEKMLENMFSSNFANCDVKYFCFTNGAPIEASSEEHYYCSKYAEVCLKIHSYVDDFDIGDDYATFYILSNGTIELVNNNQDTYAIYGSISGFTVSDSNCIGFE